MTEKPMPNEQNLTAVERVSDATSMIRASCRIASPLRVLCALEGMFFESFAAQQAQSYAEQTGRCVYSWKTTGGSNWLEAGVGCCDVLGLLVLPTGLSEKVDMEEDAYGEDSENEESYPAIRRVAGGKEAKRRSEDRR
jgi:hypothetical protein